MICILHIIEARRETFVNSWMIEYENAGRLFPQPERRALGWRQAEGDNEGKTFGISFVRTWLKTFLFVLVVSINVSDAWLLYKIEGFF